MIRNFESKKEKDRSFLGLAEDKISFLKSLCEEAIEGKGMIFVGVKTRAKETKSLDKTYRVVLLEPSIYEKAKKNAYNVTPESLLTKEKIMNRKTNPRPIGINVGNILSVVNIYEGEELLLSLSYDLENGLSKEQLKSLESKKVTFDIEEDNIVFKIQDEQSKNQDSRTIKTSIKSLAEVINDSSQDEVEGYIYHNITEPLLCPYSDLDISQEIMVRPKTTTKKKVRY